MTCREEGDVEKEYQVLSELQETDLSIDELKEKQANLAEREAYQTLEEKLGLLRNDLATAEEPKGEEKLAQDKLEGEVEILSSKIEGEKEKLYSGKVTNPKELADIQKEIKSLEAKKDEMETDLLEKLEILDGIGKKTTSLEQEIAQTQISLNQAKEVYNEVNKKIEDEIGTLNEKRQTLANEIDDELFSLYERLRQEKGGLAVAKIKGEMCLGCHMELPAEEVDKMMQSAGLWRCSECGRILLR